MMTPIFFLWFIAELMANVMMRRIRVVVVSGRLRITLVMAREGFVFVPAAGSPRKDSKESVRLSVVIEVLFRQ